MRIGLSTAAFYGRMETDAAAAHIARLSIPCCEVFLETFSEYVPSFGQMVKQQLGNTQAVSIHSKTQHFEGDIFGLSKRQREDAFAWMDSFLSSGEALDVGVYVFHGPASIRTANPDFSKWKKSIDRAISLAASHGIDFCWEVVSWCQLNSPERVKLFRELWPDLHFVLDVKQVHELGQNPLEYVDAMGEKLRHVHVLDHDDYGAYLLPGEGVSDFQTFARALHENGYRGDIILEPYAHVVKNDEALLRSIEWLRETFGAQ